MGPNPVGDSLEISAGEVGRVREVEKDALIIRLDRPGRAGEKDEAGVEEGGENVGFLAERLLRIVAWSGDPSPFPPDPSHRPPGGNQPPGDFRGEGDGGFPPAAAVEEIECRAADVDELGNGGAVREAGHHPHDPGRVLVNRAEVSQLDLFRHARKSSERLLEAGQSRNG